MAINERLIHTAAEAAAGGGTGNQEEGLILHLDANDVDSYDGDGSVWYDITNHEYTPAVDPSDHFNTVTYSGNSSANAITGVGFQPDLVWIKRRNSAVSHYLNDSLTPNSYLRPDTNDADTTSSTFTSFDSDGFTLASSALGNNSSGTYVAWCFKAGGTAVSNTDGDNGGSDVTSSVSANADLGFSIVKWTDINSSGTAYTVGHGLDVPPEMIITKETNDTGNWVVYAKGATTKDQYLILQSTGSVGSLTNVFGAAEPNATVFGQQSGTSGTAGKDMIAYCFASKRGVSKVGSYKGTGSSGNKVYTGFEPAFVIMKKSSASGGSWLMVDNKRKESDGDLSELFADTTTAESGSGYNIDFNADGFTLNTTTGNANTNNATYIYLAFATEKPDSLIDDTELGLHLDAGDTSSYDPSSDGSTWSDLTTGNHDVTLTSMNANQHDEEIGGWFEFDGSSDYGTIPHSTDLNISTSFTVEAWVNRDDNGEGYIAVKQGGSGAYGYYLQFHNNTAQGYSLAAYNTSNSRYTAHATIAKSGTAGQWQHVVGTCDGSNVKIYVNGDLKGTTAFSGTPAANTVETVIGAYASPYSGKFDGKIGQVRIYQTALTADQILQNYRFTKNDYPNGYNATLQNGASWNSGGYMVLDGANDKISIPDANVFSLEAGSKRSFSVWFKDTENSSSYRVLFSKGGSNKWEYAMFMYFSGTNRGIGFTSYNNGASSIDARNYSSSNTWLSTNTWHHLVVTVDFDAELCKVYVDGTERASDNDFVYGAYSNTDPFIFGGRADLTNNFFQGHVNNFKLYDKILTQTEITALKDAGYQG